MPRCGYRSRCRGTSGSSAIDETSRFQIFFRLAGPDPQHRGRPRTQGPDRELAPSNTYTWVAVTTRSETASRSCGRCRPAPERIEILTRRFGEAEFHRLPGQGATCPAPERIEILTRRFGEPEFHRLPGLPCDLYLKTRQLSPQNTFSPITLERLG